MCLHKFYHYTNKEGMQGIVQSGQILQSKSGYYGTGVYFTRMDPTNGRINVCANNWNAAGPHFEDNGFGDYCICVKLPTTKVRRFRDNGRVVFLLKEDVQLNLTDWKVFSKYEDHHAFVQAQPDYESDFDCDTDCECDFFESGSDSSAAVSRAEPFMQFVSVRTRAPEVKSKDQSCNVM